jgi:hypothetical protein
MMIPSETPLRRRDNRLVIANTGSSLPVRGGIAMPGN